MKMKLLMLLSIVALGACLLVNIVQVTAQTQQALQTQELVLSALPGQKAQVVFGQERHTYAAGADDGGFFITNDNKEVMRIDEAGRVTVSTSVLAAKELAAGSLRLGGVNQWRMASLEAFDQLEVKPSVAGWTCERVYQCGAIYFLAGEHNPTKPSCSKTYENLPSHNQIRLTGTVHFVDDFQGETGYIQVNGHYVFTHSHDQRNTLGDFNICGSPLYPESKLTVPFDIILPHTESTLKISFGSTLEPNAVAEFGVSNLALWLRDRPVPANANTGTTAAPSPSTTTTPAARK